MSLDAAILAGIVLVGMCMRTCIDSASVVESVRSTCVRIIRTESELVHAPPVQPVLAAVIRV